MWSSGAQRIWSNIILIMIVWLFYCSHKKLNLCLDIIFWLLIFVCLNMKNSFRYLIYIHCYFSGRILSSKSNVESEKDLNSMHTLSSDNTDNICLINGNTLHPKVILLWFSNSFMDVNCIFYFMMYEIGFFWICLIFMILICLFVSVPYCYLVIWGITWSSTAFYAVFY